MNIAQNLSAGYQVVLILAALALGVAAFGVWMVGAERRKLKRRIEPGSATDAAPVDASVDALQLSLSSLQRFDSLQQDLRARLQQSRGEMESDRSNVGSAVQLMKRAAIEMRLPETVYEIYESLRLLPKKSQEAQAADRDWHRQVGIEPASAMIFEEAVRYCAVDFSLGAREFRISGRSYELSRSSFDELTLFESRDTAVLTVRVKLTADRVSVLETAVMSYRPGLWVGMLSEVRVRMDERRERLLLGSRHRDIEKMRTDFGLNMNVQNVRTAR